MTTATAKAAVSRVLTEDVLTISQARKKLHELTGRRPDKASISRWIHRGVGGTKLDGVRLGNQLITSEQALTRFLEARTAKSIG